MEVFVAKFDYEKEREDLLSFKEGDMFRIASKADKKWWAAYSVNRPGEYGYVPSSYLEVNWLMVDSSRLIALDRFYTCTCRSSGTIVMT